MTSMINQPRTDDSGNVCVDATIPADLVPLEGLIEKTFGLANLSNSPLVSVLCCTCHAGITTQIISLPQEALDGAAVIWVHGAAVEHVGNGQAVQAPKHDLDDHENDGHDEISVLQASGIPQTPYSATFPHACNSASRCTVQCA